MLDEAKLQKGELKAIAKVLMKMQEKKNDGNGVESVQTLARYLRKGMVKHAVRYAKNIGEDVTIYPEIRRFIHDVVYPIGYLDETTGLLVND